MTVRHGRVLKAILTIFLFPISYCFGATIYVNVNNPTPGTGASWATAYNDLNAALAAAETGPFANTVWVAKGTYKPTSTTDRTATFYLTGAVTVYGGFNGTETTLGQQDAVANPTILSGDIGIAGDITDNSYHVVTCENYNSGAFLNGFTIEYGNANAGYPGSTIPQADNTGGGVLLLTKPNDNTVAWLQFCTFTNNFAVYGGGYGAYGDGTGTTGGNTFSAYKINNCRFDNNSAVMGGAIGEVATSQVWAMGTIQNCIFTNNSSTANEGSVIYSLWNNAYSNINNEFDNSDLYNNPQPVAYSQSSSTSGHSYIWLTNDIIWQSGAPYSGPLTVASITGDADFTKCDLDLVTPISDNLDADPQFINAAAGDFHVAHCTSPVIDQGWPTGNMVNYDMDGNSRVQGSAIDIGAYEQAHPVAPAVSNPNLTYCLNATASALTATPASGNSLLWYATATGGTSTATAPTPPTSTATSEDYYVSQVDATGCEGPRASISVTISAGAALPTANPIPPYCESATAAALTATGANLLWYTTATGGTGSPTAPTPSTASPGTTPYYVTQTPAGSCESNRLEIDVAVSTPPAAPTVNPIPPYCENTTAPQLTATGSNLLWYTTATGGTGASTAPTPGTATVGSTTWYVTQTTTSCESPRTPITVTIASPSAAPTAAPQGYCENTPATPLTATGSNLLWYTTATGGTGSPTAPTPSTASPGSTTWYVTQTTTSCESPRIPVTVNVNPTPQLSIDPVNNSVCAGGTVKLQANGADSYQWNPPTGLSDPAISDPVATFQSDILYTVTGTTSGCEATAQLTLTISTDCNTGYYVPNAFSPNGDGANDLFRVKTSDVPRSFSMIVFNRYGGKIFETADIAAGWDGAIGGNLAPAGAYVYTVMLTTSSGNIVRKQGTVILVR